MNITDKEAIQALRDLIKRSDTVRSVDTFAASVSAHSAELSCHSSKISSRRLHFCSNGAGGEPCCHLQSIRVHQAAAPVRSAPRSVLTPAPAAHGCVAASVRRQLCAARDVFGGSNAPLHTTWRALLLILAAVGSQDPLLHVRGVRSHPQVIRPRWQ
eukprot:scaffold197414_cov37-Tisochrysis_lutea.AAC.2